MIITMNGMIMVHLEKYGYYNGYSDDVIDDAFDGCPEATWNVD